MKNFLAIIKDTSGTEHIIPVPHSKFGCDTKLEAAEYLLNAVGLEDYEGALIIIPSGHAVSIIIKES